PRRSGADAYAERSWTQPASVPPSRQETNENRGAPGTPGTTGRRWTIGVGPAGELPTLPAGDERDPRRARDAGDDRQTVDDRRRQLKRIPIPRLDAEPRRRPVVVRRTAGERRVPAVPAD